MSSHLVANSLFFCWEKCFLIDKQHIEHISGNVNSNVGC